jgi:hypothetical protein
MGVTKTARGVSGRVAVGTGITYDIVVTNSGDATLTGITVIDPLGAPSCPKTTLVAGESMTCTVLYTVTAADADSGRVLNVATADSAQTSPVNATSTVGITRPATPSTPSPTTAPPPPVTAGPTTTRAALPATPTSVVVRTVTAQLPVTGSTDVEPYLWAASGLFAAGAAYVIGSRRRRAL